MKRLLIALTLFSMLAMGCSPAGIYSLTAVDYNRFSEDGFFISESNSVNFEYEPISSVMAAVTSGYVREEIIAENTPNKKYKDDVYGSTNTKGKMRHVKATPDYVTDILVEEAKAKNANGIINFKFEPIREYSKLLGWQIVGYSASGMAIKR